MTDESRPYRMSLARQLSLLTGAVIALSLLIVLAVAYEALTRSALSAARETISRATKQLASLGETGIRQTRMRFTATTRDSAIRRALMAANSPSPLEPVASDAGGGAVRKALAALSAPTDSGMPIELWTANGNRVAYLGNDESAIPEATVGHTLGAPRIPRDGVSEVRNIDSLQFGRMYASGGRVYFWMVQPVLERSKPIGYI